MYMHNHTGDAIIRQDGAFIPKDPRNRDYKEFLDSGETPFPWHKEAYAAMIGRDVFMKNLIVQHGADLKIIKVHQDAVVSGMIQSAPPGFEPGDEKYVKRGPDGKLVFDMDGKFAKAKEIYDRHVWNSMSVWQRIKHKYGRKR